MPRAESLRPQTASKPLPVATDNTRDRPLNAEAVSRQIALILGPELSRRLNATRNRSAA